MPTVQWLPEKMMYGRCNTVTFSDLKIPLKVTLKSGDNTITDQQLKLIKDSPMYSQRVNEGSLVIPKTSSVPSVPSKPLVSSQPPVNTTVTTTRTTKQKP